MFSITWLKKNPLAAVGLLVMAVFIFLRIWRLGFPGETVFDEVYFPKMASQYLAGESFFDIHPPLGKLMIAVSEMIFGNTTVGWRVVSLLTGIAMIAVGYWSSQQIFKDKTAAFLTALFIAIDGLFIVYSRTGLMDGFLILFGLASLGFCWQFRTRRAKGESAWGSIFLTGLFAGLAVAVKWIGVGFLPIVALTVAITLFFDKKQKPDFADWIVWLLSFVIIPFALYTLPFLANWQSDFWNQFTLWHRQSWDYNIHLDATHPYASKWWSWPFLIRPIWFYYKGADQIVTGVDAIGNPIVWWGSTLAVVYSILVSGYMWLNRKKPENHVIDQAIIPSIYFTIAGWAAFYLPWTVIGRVLFLYHYFASYLFALLLAAFWASQALKGKLSRSITLLVIAAAVVAALAFAPIWIAYPIPQAWFNRLMWFTSWI
jgi:dolichyl-phosphate-mannose-protein mannosyltransferase